MKKLLPTILVLSLLFAGVCLQLFSNTMAMEAKMNQGGYQAVTMGSAQLGCCASAHQEDQKLVAKIFASSLLLVVLAAFSFQLSQNLLSLQHKSRVLIAARPPSLTGSIIKRE